MIDTGLDLYDDRPNAHTKIEIYLQVRVFVRLFYKVRSTFLLELQKAVHEPWPLGSSFTRLCCLFPIIQIDIIIRIITIL